MKCNIPCEWSVRMLFCSVLMLIVQLCRNWSHSHHQSQYLKWQKDPKSLWMRLKLVVLKKGVPNSTTQRWPKWRTSHREKWKHQHQLLQFRQQLRLIRKLQFRGECRERNVGFRGNRGLIWTTHPRRHTLLLITDHHWSILYMHYIYRYGLWIPFSCS